MNKKTLQRLIDGYTGNNLAEYIADALELEKHIKKTITSYKKDVDKEKQRHEKTTKELRQQMWDIQKECPHYETTYHADPSGNNDSETICNWCDKEV